MNALLDTHTFVWAVVSPSLLGPTTRRVVDDPTTRVFISAATLYEMSLKVSLGKWPDALPVLGDLDAIVRESDYTLLPILPAHALLASRLAAQHRDPFDRLLAATALHEQYTLCSADSALDIFGIRRIW